MTFAVVFGGWEILRPPRFAACTMSLAIPARHHPGTPCRPSPHLRSGRPTPSIPTPARAVPRPSLSFPLLTLSACVASPCPRSARDCCRRPTHPCRRRSSFLPSLHARLWHWEPARFSAPWLPLDGSLLHCHAFATSLRPPSPAVTAAGGRRGHRRRWPPPAVALAGGRRCQRSPLLPLIAAAARHRLLRSLPPQSCRAAFLEAHPAPAWRSTDSAARPPALP